MALAGPDDSPRDAGNSSGGIGGGHLALLVLISVVEAGWLIALAALVVHFLL